MEELEACAAAGIPVEVVPGITSAIAVPELAGIPVTHRGLTHEFVVVSGHVPPGHPASLVDRSEEHTSELQSRQYLVCRLLLEKKKKKDATIERNIRFMSTR